MKKTLVSVHGADVSSATSPGPFLDGTSSSPPLPAALERLQRALWSVACVGSLIVVAIFWGALVRGGGSVTFTSLFGDRLVPSALLNAVVSAVVSPGKSS